MRESVCFFLLKEAHVYLCLLQISSSLRIAWVYRKTEEQVAVDPTLIAALDLGVNTLVACTSTKPGFVPFLINGRPLKSLNQHYNKQREHHQKKLAKAKRFTSRQLDGSYNILRKAFPESFGKGIEAAAVQPRRLAV